MGTHVTLEHIHKSFGEVDVLTDVTITIEAGQTAAVLGPSGCGKTTLLRVIAGIEDIDQGKILFDGHDVTKARPQQRRAVLVPQEGALFPHLTVEQNIAFGLTRRNRKRQADWIATLITDLDLVGLEHRKPAALSGGQASRVAIARALAPLPNLVLLDEPFAALDKNLRESVRLAVCALARQHDITLVLVTHDQEEALSFAQNIIVLDNGSVTGMGQPHVVYQQPPSLGVARFLGEANVVDAIVSDGVAVSELGHQVIAGSVAGERAGGNQPAAGSGGSSAEAVTLGEDSSQPDGSAQPGAGVDGGEGTGKENVAHGGVGECAGTDGAQADEAKPVVQYADGTKGTIMIRPEQLDLVERGTLDDEAAAVTIDHVVYHGHDSVIHAVTPSGTALLIRVQHSIDATKAYGVRVHGPVVFYPKG